MTIYNSEFQNLSVRAIFIMFESSYNHTLVWFPLQSHYDLNWIAYGCTLCAVIFNRCTVVFRLNFHWKFKTTVILNFAVES